MRAVLVTAALLVACGGTSEPQPFTWGDMSAQLASDYCTAREGCGWGSNTDRCYRSNYFALCELDQNCHVELEPEAEEVSAACSMDLTGVQGDDCVLMFLFGILPDSCQEALDYRPEVED